MPTSFKLQSYVIKRAEELGYDISEIMSKSRLADLIRCKHLIIYELRTEGFSFQEIQNFFGYADSSIITYIQRKFGRVSHRKQSLNQCLIIPSTW